MADEKEVKLAAARKRAAELKAKKKQNAQTKAGEADEPDSATTTGGALAGEGKDSDTPATGESKTSTTESQADDPSTLQRDLQEAQSQSENLTQLKANELATLKEAHQSALDTLAQNHAVEVRRLTDASSKSSAAKIAKAEQTAREASADLEQRLNESQARTSTLQAENKAILSQLTELRTHLMQLQDEKLALVETVNRLKQEASASSRNSSANAHRKLSKEFDRSTALQDVSLFENTEVDTQAPSAMQNIQIDLIGWYDKHAGVVIEV